MSKKAPSPVAICPFYKDTGKQMIYCEGLEPDSSIHLAYGRVERRKDHEIKYCKSWNYENCFVAKMHLDRYEHEEPE